MLANLRSRRGAFALKADLSVGRPTLKAPSPQVSEPTRLITTEEGILNVLIILETPWHRKNHLPR